MNPSLSVLGGSTHGSQTPGSGNDLKALPLVMAGPPFPREGRCRSMEPGAWVGQKRDERQKLGKPALEIQGRDNFPQRIA